MTIKSINIKNIRGIDCLSISNNIIKNRPNILVASNGFGKTSIATAFKCISDQTSIKIPDEARHLHNENNHASMELEIEKNGEIISLSATETARSNSIRKHFDIHVIGDMRRIKASAKNMGQFSKASAKQIIDPIVICSKPIETHSPYKITATRQEFGNHNRLLQNLDKSIFESHQFIMRSTEFIEAIAPVIKERRWAKMESIRGKIVEHEGSDEDAINAYIADIQQILTDAEFKSAAQIIADTSDQDQKTTFLSLWQLAFLARANLEQLKGYLQCLRYKEIKKSLKAHIKDINNSWKDVNVKETEGKLVIEMPDPSHISNGQRDIILMVAMFHVAINQLTKENAIIIIDEIFDYLDDANLTVAQYYVTEIIEDYKRQGRSIYPIILTHLNPAFFKNYVFSKQNIIYLDAANGFTSTEAMKRLIAAREDGDIDERIKENISKYLVHYHTGNFDFSDDLNAIKGIKTSWGKNGKFQKFLNEEFGKYEQSVPYDPLAICAITRRAVEALAYIQIAHLPEAGQFFDIHKTTPKLDWASQHGATIPESHYLLRIIFDDGLHWSPTRDNTIPIVAKLGNPIIKKMITDLAKKYLHINSSSPAI